jgi:hypothetical protein
MPMIATTAVRRRTILEQLFPPLVDVDDDNSESCGGEGGNGRGSMANRSFSEAYDVDADAAAGGSENSSNNIIVEGPQCAICLEGIGESWMYFLRGYLSHEFFLAGGGISRACLLDGLLTANPLAIIPCHFFLQMK